MFRQLPTRDTVYPRVEDFKRAVYSACLNLRCRVVEVKNDVEGCDLRCPLGRVKPCSFICSLRAIPGTVPPVFIVRTLVDSHTCEFNKRMEQLGLSEQCMRAQIAMLDSIHFNPPPLPSTSSQPYCASPSQTLAQSSRPAPQSAFRRSGVDFDPCSSPRKQDREALALKSEASSRKEEDDEAEPAQDDAAPRRSGRAVKAPLPFDELVVPVVKPKGRKAPATPPQPPPPAKKQKRVRKRRADLSKEANEAVLSGAKSLYLSPDLDLPRPFERFPSRSALLVHFHAFAAQRDFLFSRLVHSPPDSPRARFVLSGTMSAELPRRDKRKPPKMGQFRVEVVGEQAGPEFDRKWGMVSTTVVRIPSVSGGKTAKGKEKEVVPAVDRSRSPTVFLHPFLHPETPNLKPSPSGPPSSSSSPAESLMPPPPPPRPRSPTPASIEVDFTPPAPVSLELYLESFLSSALPSSSISSIPLVKRTLLSSGLSTLSDLALFLLTDPVEGPKMLVEAAWARGIVATAEEGTAVLSALSTVARRFKAGR
ncbi:hypothetical protein JCM8097_003786 [Rhodosporidiobolus ruineniae]